MRGKTTGKSTGAMSGTNVWKYQDMLHLPHHTSAKHPHMDRINRAAQFAPFAALTGHDAALLETRRLTDEFKELDESRKAELDEKLRYLAEHLREEPHAIITYFCPDGKKEGGAYLSAVGIVRKVDEDRKVVIMEYQTVIPFDKILEVEMG